MSVAFPTHSARMQAVCRAYNSLQYFDCREGGVFSRPRALPEPRALSEWCRARIDSRKHLLRTAGTGRPRNKPWL